jgi:hypothetical protein
MFRVMPADVQRGVLDAKHQVMFEADHEGVESGTGNHLHGLALRVGVVFIASLRVYLEPPCLIEVVSF